VIKEENLRLHIDVCEIAFSRWIPIRVAIWTGACERRVYRGKYPGALTRIALVRESIANLCMDFQKSTDINMDIHDFWMSVFNYPYKRGYPH